MQRRVQLIFLALIATALLPFARALRSDIGSGVDVRDHFTGSGYYPMGLL